jgi:hypothetical protein
MSRFTDDFPFFGAPPNGPPATANILLSRLGVSFAPNEIQREAVAQWLATNTPGPRLTAELHKRHLIKAVTA